MATNDDCSLKPSEKQERPYTPTEASPLLSFFWNLVSTEASVRIQGAKGLIMYLANSQKLFEDLKGAEEMTKNLKKLREEDDAEEINVSADDEEATKAMLSFNDQNGKLEAVCSSDLVYSLKRLLRGLPSSREEARQGFSVALTMLLTQFSHLLTLKSFFDLVLKYTAVGGSCKGTEEKDLYLGRLCSVIAVVQSGMLERCSSLKKSHLFFIIDTLFTVSTKKVYLREICAKIIISLVEKNLPGSLEVIARHLEEKMDNNIEKLWISLAINRINSGAYSALEINEASIPTFVAEMIKSSTSSHPRIHSAWADLISFCTEKKLFCEFWLNAVDNALFNSNSHEKKFLGFQLFDYCFENQPLSMIPNLFTPYFIRCLMNSLHSGEAFLNAAARHTVKKLVEVTEHRASKEGENIRVAVLAQFISHDSGLLGEAVAKLSKSLSIESKNNYIDSIEKELNAEGNSNARNVSLIDILCGLLKNSFSKELPSESVSLRIMEIIFSFAFLKEVDSSLSDYCKSKLDSLLTLLYAFEKSSFDEATKAAFSKVLAALESKSKKKSQLRSEFKSNESFVSAFKSGMKLKQLSLKEEVQDLITVSLLGLFQKNRFSSSLEELDELEQLAQRFAAKKAASKKKTKAVEEAPLIEVFVDFLLGMLSKPSGLIRKVVDANFKAFAEDLTVESFNLIIEVLKAGEGAEERAEFFDNEEQEGEQEDSEEEEQEEEEVDPELKAKIEAALQAPKEDLPDLNDEEMAVFDEKLQEVFKQKKIEKNAEGNAVRDILHFKFRVLELIDLFVKKHANSPLIQHIYHSILSVAELYAPYFQSASNNVAHEKSKFFQKVSLLCEKMSKIKDSPSSVDSTQIDAVFELLKSSTFPMNNLYSGHLFYLLRMQDKSARVNEELSTLIDEFFSNKKSPLSISFFVEFVEKCDIFYSSSIFTKTIEFMKIDQLEESKKRFKVIQALKIIEAFVAKHGGKAELEEKFLAFACECLAVPMGNNSFSISQLREIMKTAAFILRKRSAPLSSSVAVSQAIKDALSKDHLKTMKSILLDISQRLQ